MLYPVEQGNEKRVLVSSETKIEGSPKHAEQLAYECSIVHKCEEGVDQWKVASGDDEPDQVEGLRCASRRLNGKENHDNEVSSIVERVEQASDPKPDNRENNTD